MTVDIIYRYKNRYILIFTINVMQMHFLHSEMKDTIGGHQSLV